MTTVEITDAHFVIIADALDIYGDDKHGSADDRQKAHELAAVLYELCHPGADPDVILKVINDEPERREVRVIND